MAQSEIRERIEGARDVASRLRKNLMRDLHELGGWEIAPCSLARLGSVLTTLCGLVSIESELTYLVDEIGEKN